ncbi:MAG: DUF1553 domain-containing protein [Verrucomicrobiales bacterium]
MERWSDNKSRPGDSDLMNWLLENRRLPQSILPGSRLAALVDEYRRTEASISFPRTVNSMDEREVEKAAYPINVRGSVDAPGKLMAPGFLRLFPDHGQVSESSGSGRLELANLLLDPQNPLTARVYVNRVWQWVFGTGLVATPDDFGRLGARPSHPELLDWLALEFIREGWSTKTLLRHLVLSNTFRQSGLVSEVARRLDPSNRLLHHYPTRRLEAESIRDSSSRSPGVWIRRSTAGPFCRPAAWRTRQAVVQRPPRRCRPPVALSADVDHGPTQVSRRLQSTGPEASLRQTGRHECSGTGPGPAQ